MAKMKDVAELAGVSNAAVSRYLNGGYISNDKAERIKAAIAETGYVRSSQARALRTGATHLIGVIVPKINSESVSRITAGVSQVLRERGYQMLLANTDNVAERELDCIDLFQNHPVDGILLVATELGEEHERAIVGARVPVVLIGQRCSWASCVFHDDLGAGRELGSRVAREHAGRIGYIGVPDFDQAAGIDRQRGFAEGLESGGSRLDPELVRCGSFTIDSGYRAARELLEIARDLSFIAAATDTMAAGAIRALDEVLGAGEGVRRVSGFGDNAFLRSVTGGIPTVHYGYLTSGIEATELLLERVRPGEGSSADPVEIKLGYQVMGI